MKINEQINADFITAFKNREMRKKTFLGLLKGEIQSESTREGVVMTDEIIIGIIRKVEKSLKTIDTEESKQELEWLKPYLPTLMSEETIRQHINTYKESGVTNMGQLMGKFNQEFKGQADNSVVSRIVKEVLAV